jgi:hypothetical protein
MVAGLFARHGVFFGDTGPGDADRRFNRKGYFEHPAIIARTESGDFADWPAAWWQTLLAEGYELGTPWGIKRGPMAWPWVKILKPALIVFCKRNARQVVRSRLRRWPDRLFPRRDLRLAAARLKLIGEEAEAPDDPDRKRCRRRLSADSGRVRAARDRVRSKNRRYLDRCGPVERGRGKCLIPCYAF